MPPDAGREGPTDDLVVDLLSSYSRTQPPSGVVKMQVQLALQNILQLDTREQTLTFQGWFRSYWADERLTWDPDECARAGPPGRRPDQDWGSRAQDP